MLRIDWRGGEARLEAGRPDRRLLQSFRQEMMMTHTRLVAADVARSGQILDIF